MTSELTPNSTSYNELTPQCAQQPQARDFVRKAMQPLVLVYGVPEAASSPGFWELYFGALCALPSRAVLAAVQDYADSEEGFFPKPGQLRALALRRARTIWDDEAREAGIRQQLAAREGPLQLEGPREKPEQITNGFHALLKTIDEAAPAPRPSHAPIQAKTDGSGVSPELRSLVERQRQ